MNTTFTFIELTGLLIIILAGFWLGSPGNTNYFEMPDKMRIIRTISAIYDRRNTWWSRSHIFCILWIWEYSQYRRWNKESCKGYSKGLLISVAATTALYILVAISTSALVGWKVLSLSEAPLSLAAEKTFGWQGVTILSLIALFATANTTLMMLISSSRIIYGISKDRFFPKT